MLRQTTIVEMAIIEIETLHLAILETTPLLTIETMPPLMHFEGHRNTPTLPMAVTTTYHQDYNGHQGQQGLQTPMDLPGHLVHLGYQGQLGQQRLQVPQAMSGHLAQRGNQDLQGHSTTITPITSTSSHQSTSTHFANHHSTNNLASATNAHQSYVDHLDSMVHQASMEHQASMDLQGHLGQQYPNRDHQGIRTDTTNVTNIRTEPFTFQMFNVCGLKSKLGIPEFTDNLKAYDITLMCETKLDKADDEHIMSYITPLRLKAFFKHRKTLSNCRSGGLCIMFKEHMEKYIKIINSKCKLVQWLSISKLLTGTDKDVILGNTYIPPDRTRYQSLTPFQDLHDDMQKFSNCYVCIAGDLNSHTSIGRDYGKVGDFIPEQLNFDIDAQNHLLEINWLHALNIRLNRSNSDKRITICVQGKQLIDFCKSNTLLICNGRLNSDLSGKATTSDGSLIDYLLASPVILSKIVKFTVHDFDAIFSDKHCRISWSVQCIKQDDNPNNTTDRSNVITIKKSHRKMWASENAVDFAKDINLEDIKSIKDKVGNYDEHIDCILNDIQKLFKCSADNVLGREYEYELDINKKIKPMKFNRQTLNKRNIYFKARRMNKGSTFSRNRLTIASKAYKKSVLINKALIRRQIIKKLRNAKTKDPKYYWSVLNRQQYKPNQSTGNTSLDMFYEGFKELSGTESHGNCSNDGESGVDEQEVAEHILDSEFTEEEIYAEVKNLKNGKACGKDKILNEFIKVTFNEMKEVYIDLFNRILDEGQIPESWTIGMITPIFKNKGDRGDFNNYRGITILSCLGKLFTSVINTRLNNYANNVNLLNENQTGFRKKYSTLDHIFLLKNLIDIVVKNGKQKLYCAFVDYKKAFDTVWRSALWHKLVMSGIKGKLYNVIVNMYKNIKSCVSHDGKLSDYFVSFSGVRQGENLSPFLFALFVNDIEQFLLQSGCTPIELRGPDFQIFLKLLIIMYADDTVLFASSKENLQVCLNGLKGYCDKWKLQVNADKTKIIIFSNKKANSENTFTMGDTNIEVVDEFKYLGVTFKFNGDFNINIEAIKEQGNRAIFSLIKKARKYSLPVDLQFDLFDKMVMPVILYGCEIWGYTKLGTLETLHLKFCKLVLKLKSTTPDLMIYGETGRFKIEYYAKKRIINFWSSIVCGNRSKLSFTMYNLCKQKYLNGHPTSEWFVNLASMLVNDGITFIPDTDIFVKAAVKHMLTNLKTDSKTKWLKLVNNETKSPKCSVLYKHIKESLECEYYLTNLPYNLRIAMSRIRTCNHRLPIETGRYKCNRKQRQDRICDKCNSNSVGDELHFILECKNPTLLELRIKYISPYYSSQPSMSKLIELFNNRGQKLFKLARYVAEGLKIY